MTHVLVSTVSVAAEGIGALEDDDVEAEKGH